MSQASPLAQVFLNEVRDRSYGTILADPPWQFSNRTGKMAPEHRRLKRYPTLTLQAIKAIPVASGGGDAEPSLPLGAKCHPARRTGSDGSVGISVQN